MILFHNTVPLDCLMGTEYTHTHTHFYFENYSLPLLTAESFLHLDKTMKVSKQIEGKEFFYCQPAIHFPLYATCGTTVRGVRKRPQSGVRN